MEDHEYELALEPDSDDLRFGSDSGESPLPSPRLADESALVSQDWQAEVDDLLSEQTAVEKEEKGPKEKEGKGPQEKDIEVGEECFKDRVVMEVEASHDPCFNTTAAQEQERDRRRWGFPQLRPLMYTGDVNLEEEGIICTSITLSSGKVLGGPVEEDSSQAPKLPKELSRELQKFGNLSTRLALESQKVEVWNGKLVRLFGIHIDRVQKARKREFDANKRREGNLIRENKRLLAQNRQLRLALDNSRSEIKFTSSQFTRLDLENM